MVYRPHTLVAFGGTLAASFAGGTDDEWQCGIRGVQADVLADPVHDPVAYMNGLAPNLATWFADPASLMSTGATLDWLKVNTIGPDGKYVDPSTVNRHDYHPPIQGAIVPIVPDILVCAWSWRTAKSRGPGSHGRIYPPNNVTGSSPSMGIGGTDRSRHLVAAQELMHWVGLGNGDLAEMQPVIASKVNATNTPITEIWIGSIYDVQRRRKGDEVEIYTKGPITTH